MVEVTGTPEDGAEIADEASRSQKRGRRRIPGNLPYTTSSGVLKTALDKIPDAEKPEVFSTDFLATVLGVRGGPARPIPPILKSTGLLERFPAE